MTPLVMGVLNVTPDSFSDGGRWLDPAVAIAQGRALFDAGADVVDVGGESSRPGAAPVGLAVELQRVVPVVEALSPFGRVSVDTVKPEVAAAAVDAGATLINDISGTLHHVAAERNVGWVAMHMQGTPATMQHEPTYRDVVGEVTDHLVAAADRARADGVDEVWIDPGIGFGKTFEHNLALLANVSRLVETGHPVLMGTSRKAFLGRLLADADGVDEPVSVDDRLEGSVATAVWAMAEGARMVRVHDVPATVQAVQVVCG